MRKFTILNIVLLLSLILAACAQPTTTTPPTAQVLIETVVVKETSEIKVVVTATSVPPTSAPQPTDKSLTAAEQWAKANGLGPYQPATEDWAAVEAAAIKEGKVVVYANSSHIGMLTEAWNALYPNIVFEGSDTDGIDTKMAAEQEAGNVVGDIWFNSDGHILYGKFVPNQWIWSFVPPGVVIPEVTADRPFAIARHGTDLLHTTRRFTQKAVRSLTSGR
jgi:hypothetical protein